MNGYNFLRKPYPAPHDKDQDCQVELKDVSGTSVTVFRQNHGLAHAARQACMVENLLPLFANHAKNNDLKFFTENIIQNPVKKHIIQIAAIFLTAGRIHELRAIHDPKGHQQSRENSKKAFEEFLSVYYPVEKSSQDMEILIKICSDAILLLAPDMSEKAKTSEEKVIFHLLNAAHILDTPRVPGLWIKQEGTQVELAKNMLNKLLYHPDSVFTQDSADKELLDKALDELWKLSLLNLRKTGDRIPDLEVDYKGYEFIECNQNPAYLSQVLELTKPLPLIIRETKQDLRDNKIYFDALIYILTHSVDPDIQLQIFKTEPEFSDLICFACDYLEKHPNMDVETDGILIDKIKQAFHSTEFQRARKKILSNPITPVSFGDGSMEKLPRLLKASIPFLLEAKLDSQENIIKLKRLYQDHPDAIYYLVEGLRYLSPLNKLNEDTFQLLCMQTAISPDILLDFLGNYKSNSNVSTDVYIQITELYINHKDLKKIILFTLYSCLGKLDLLEKLFKKEQCPQKKENMIISNHCAPFCYAAVFGHTDVIKYLFLEAPHLSARMIDKLNMSYGTFKTFNLFGRPDMLECFCNNAKSYQKNQMVSVAASRGRLDVMEYLFNTFTLEEKESIAASRVFTSAAMNGHINIIEYLFNAAPAKKTDMLAVDDFAVLGAIDLNNRGMLDVNNWLLSKSRICFAEKLSKPPSCIEYTELKPYVNMELRFLHKKFDDFKCDHPDSTFLLSNHNEVKIYFHILCNLIRQHPGVVLKDTGFLLSITTIKTLVLAIVTASGREAVLLREKFSLNDETIAMLKDNSEVKMLSAHSPLVRHHVVTSASAARSIENKTTSIANTAKPFTGK